MRDQHAAADIAASRVEVDRTPQQLRAETIKWRRSVWRKTCRCHLLDIRWEGGFVECGQCGRSMLTLREAGR